MDHLEGAGQKCLLSQIGILYCGYCGGKVKVSVTGKGALKKKYYYCGVRQSLGVSSCNRSKLISMDKVDHIVLHELKNRLSKFNLDEIDFHSHYAKKRILKGILDLSGAAHQYLLKSLENETEKTMSDFNSYVKNIQSTWESYQAIKSPTHSPELPEQELI